MITKELDIIRRLLKQHKIAYSLQTKDNGDLAYYIFGRYDDHGNFNCMRSCNKQWEQYYIYTIKPNYDFTLEYFIYEDYYLDNDAYFPKDNRLKDEIYQLDNGQKIWCECVFLEEFETYNGNNFEDIKELFEMIISPGVHHGAKRQLEYLESLADEDIA